MNARIPPSVLNADTTLSQVSALWDAEIVPQLQDYIRIPAKSAELRTGFCKIHLEADHGKLLTHENHFYFCALKNA